MGVNIHPTAIVDPKAFLDHDVTIGPYCIIGAGAFVGARTNLISNVQLVGHVRLGEDNTIWPFTVIGGEPQDKGYKQEPTWVVVGDRNIFRESVTIHRGTTKESGVTVMGSDNYLMVGVHVAHDCVIGSNVMVANNTAFGGHVHVDDYATLSAQIGVHHYTSIGSYSFVGGMSRITTDVPPYMLVEGNPSEVRCVNLVGLKRRGFSHAEIQLVTEAHRLLYRVKMGASQAKQILTASDKMTGPVANLFEFIDRQHAGKNGRARERLRAA